MKLEEISFSNRKVYLAPFNNLLKLDEIKLDQLNVKIEGYIDNFKVGENIYSSCEIKKQSTVIIISPNYWESIVNSLPKYVECYVKINNHTYIRTSNILRNKYISFLNKKEQLFRILFDKFNKFIFKFAREHNLYLTANLRRIKQLENTNKRIFIIGNGPSLSINDLDKLKNDITIASNKIFLAFDQTSWRPTYYTILDPLDIEEYYDEISKYNLGIKFFPNFYQISKLKDSLYYPVFATKTYKDIRCTANILEGFYSGESVSFGMIDFALSLGSKEIYLIGFDHNYNFPKGYENSLYKISEGEVNHFHQDYRKKGDLWTEPRVENITFQFQVIKDFCKQNDIKIFNATRGGYLNIFERVDFDHLF